GAEVFNVALTGPTGGAALGSQPSAQVIIRDDDTSFSFSSANYTAVETSDFFTSGTNVTITVIRQGGTNGFVTVDFGTADGTATEATFDYFGTSGTLSFPDGVTSNSFTVFVFDDTEVEGNETVNLSLSNPSPGTTLGSQPTATLTIIDN